MKNRRLALKLSCVVISIFVGITSQSVLDKSVSASQEICRIELLRDGVVIQEISEPFRPEQPSTDDRQALRVRERQLRQYENRLERFERRIAKFKERVERSQQRRQGRLSMVFSENCEDFKDENISVGSNDLPSPDTLGVVRK